jgi:hypothetical protein
MDLYFGESCDFRVAAGCSCIHGMNTREQLGTNVPLAPEERSSIMKKVRYLAMAVGAVPALGLLMPAGNAVAGATHIPAAKGKAVSLDHTKGARPDYKCGGDHGSGVTFSG